MPPKSKPRGNLSRLQRGARSVETQQQPAQEAAALVTQLRGATIVGAAAESSSSTSGRQATDDSHPTRGRKWLSTPESREKDAARKQAARSELSPTDNLQTKVLPGARNDEKGSGASEMMRRKRKRLQNKLRKA